jgi:hypothetical protein
MARSFLVAEVLQFPIVKIAETIPWRLRLFLKFQIC